MNPHIINSNRWMSFVTLAVGVCLASGAALAAAPGAPMACGKVPGYKTSASMKLVDPINNLQLTFVGRAPSNDKIASALLDCLKTASAKDGRYDILATAWKHKPGTSDSDDDDVTPQPGKMFTYQASDKSIGVRDISLTKLR